jgi:hypothetical protein
MAVTGEPLDGSGDGLRLPPARHDDQLDAVSKLHIYAYLWQWAAIQELAPCHCTEFREGNTKDGMVMLWNRRTLIQGLQLLTYIRVPCAA